MLLKLSTLQPSSSSQKNWTWLHFTNLPISKLQFATGKPGNYRQQARRDLGIKLSEQEEALQRITYGAPKKGGELVMHWTWWWSWVWKSYPPVNKHSNGKSLSWIGNTSSNGGFSIAMLDYRSVFLGWVGFMEYYGQKRKIEIPKGYRRIQVTNHCRLNSIYIYTY